jgi:DnaA family protein
MKQLAFDIAPPSPTIDNFIAGANAELLHVLKGLLAGEQAERFVYIWGGSGSGKSHLLQAVVNGAKESGLGAILITCDKDTVLGSDIAGYDVVAVDDVHHLAEEAQTGLFNIYNRMREGSGILLVSGPFAPMHLRVRRDLATRLGAGLVYQVHSLTDEEKAEALKCHAKARGFVLSQDVVNYLLRYWKRDLPSLMGVLNALDRYSLETKRPITVPLLRELLQLN